MKPLLLLLTLVLVSCNTKSEIKFAAYDDLVIGTKTLNLYKNGTFTIELGIGEEKGNYHLNNDTIALYYFNKTKYPKTFIITTNTIETTHKGKRLKISRTK